MIKRKLEKGELSFLLILGVFSIFLFIISLRLFINEPIFSSQGFFPLLVSFLMIIMIIISIWELRKFDSAFDGELKFLAKLKSTFQFILPGKILQVLIFVLLYAIILPRTGFEISTLLFLFFSMILLKKESVRKLLLISVVIVVFLVGFFEYIFRVTLP